MKDPTQIQDPKLVSAFSVYKGLVPGLSSYQDTSEGSKASKRRKAKKKNRLAKSEGDDRTVLKADESKPVEVQNGKSANGTTATPRKDKKQEKAVNGQDGNKNTPKDKSKMEKQIEEEANSSQHEATVSKRKKSRNRNRKKNKQNQDVSVANGDSELDSTMVLDSTVNLSDDEDAPPSKARKMAPEPELLPNPFAKANGNAKRKSNYVQAPQELDTSIDSTTSKSKKKNKKKNKRQLNESQDQPSSSSDLVQKEPTPPLFAKSILRAVNLDGNKSKTKDSSYQVTSNAPPADARAVFCSKRIEDSVEHGKIALEWLLDPVTTNEFMTQYWEKKPLLVKRKHEASQDYYKWILTTQMFDDMLRRNVVKYNVNLDITSYTNGKRETLSETMQGRVRPAVVWDYYNNGCSIRMLNPQSFIRPLWRLNSSLHEWFGSFVGANMYLTPPESQGFAPHYDDIDAFILQVEGKKQWKLYAPRNEDEKLARFSSRNFSETEDNLGEPILDVVLEEGDLLYFPRGMIHQAKTVDGEHSLHITLSCHQLNTYGDLLKHHVNHALDKLMAKDVSFRAGLPTDYLSFMGIAHNTTKDSEIIKKRRAFSKKVEELVFKLAKEPADFAADAMGKKFVWDSLPPYLTAKERETCVVEDGEFMQNGRVFNRVEFGPEVEIKLIRKNCVRLVVEEGLLKLYYSTENSLVYHEEEAQFLELSVELAPAVSHLISQYPEYTKIEDLPLSSGDISEKIQVVSDLWERGLIFTKEPLEPCDVEGEFESGSENDDDQQLNRTNEDGEEDDVESINLSDLPGEDELEDDLSDDYYEGTMEESDTDSSDGQETEDYSDDQADDGQADLDEFMDSDELDDDDEDDEDDMIGEGADAYITGDFVNSPDLGDDDSLDDDDDDDE